MSESPIIKNIDPSKASVVYALKMNEAIAASLKTLMETKGLYQSVSIDREGSFQWVFERVNFMSDAVSLLKATYTLPKNFALSDSILYVGGRDGSKEPLLTIQPVNFKLFCARCDRDEAFKPVWHQDITNAISVMQVGPGAVRPLIREGFQFFTLIYQCQSCLGLPEAFLIMRDGLKLSIQGRSPIQSMAVSSFIPKPESKWYREAVIATKVGRTLAAIFYLRVFIEQFSRRVTGIKDRRTGDEILSEYSGTIPEPPRGAMPSLKEWYGKLSEAIHAANEDSEMLKNAFEEVDRHFEFRRIYKMSETPQRKLEPDPEFADSSEQA